jgi:hypothetical protein
VAGAIEFLTLSGVDLVVEQVYRGGTRGTVADDPLSVLLPVGNQGGFRYKGSPARGDVRVVVLYTSGHNADWPDELAVTTGTFTYYGDNRDPGRELHDTQRRGNRILRDAFANASGGATERALVPPFLLFEKASSEGRDVRFRGLMVPGSPLVLADEQLVAIWRNRQGQRFQNYRATFTVLDASVVQRSWIDNVLAGQPEIGAPRAWSRWVDGGAYYALVAPSTTHHRTRAEQLPADVDGLGLLNTLWGHFRDEPVRFERCAAELFRFSVPALESVDVTRPTRDGGRDALGRLAIGPSSDPIRLDFALEAKCYEPGNSVGVREMSRLISRIKHREFGVMVTTSYVHDQAYREIREDGHPIIVFAGADIVSTLRTVGITTIAALRAWLDQEFPTEQTASAPITPLPGPSGEVGWSHAPSK